MSVGDRIAKKREELGLNQTDLANRAGLKPPTISQYESESRNPSYEALVKLSNALGVTTDYLIKGDQSKESEISGAVARVLLRLIQKCSDGAREQILEYAELLVGKPRFVEIPIFERPVDYANYLLSKHTNGQLPIDVFEIAKELGIQVFEQELNDEEGFLVNASQRIIFLNSSIRYKPRKKFTLATLMGHAILPWHIKNKYSRLHDKATLQTEDVEEMEAHDFAVSLIMPKFHLEKDLISHASIQGIKGLAAEKYDVSLFALANRLVEYDKDRYALLQSKDFQVLQTFSGRRPLVDKINPETFAGSFFHNPSLIEEVRRGEVPAAYWLEDAQPGEMLIEETIYNPELQGKALTLLIMKKRRK